MIVHSRARARTRAIANGIGRGRPCYAKMSHHRTAITIIVLIRSALLHAGTASALASGSMMLREFHHKICASFAGIRFSGPLGLLGDQIAQVQGFHESRFSPTAGLSIVVLTSNAHGLYS